MILPKTNIHLIQKHLPKRLGILVTDKVKLFRSANLFTASPAEQIGVLIDYRVIKTSIDCGGYCDSENATIAFNGRPDFKTIFHELAHALQAYDEVFSKTNNRLLSVCLNYEWQAETIAYKLFSELIDKSISHTEFNVYFNMLHVDFLRSWYGKRVEFDEPDIKLKTN